MRTANVNYVYQDGLDLRKEFCDIANKYFKLNISITDNQALEEDIEDEEEGDDINESDDTTV